MPTRTRPHRRSRSSRAPKPGHVRSHGSGIFEVGSITKKGCSWYVNLNEPDPYCACPVRFECDHMVLARAYAKTWRGKRPTRIAAVRVHLSRIERASKWRTARAAKAFARPSFPAESDGVSPDALRLRSSRKEKTRVERLLHDLCRKVIARKQGEPKKGRKPMPIHLRAKALVWDTYVRGPYGHSAADFEQWVAQRDLPFVPHQNSMCNYRHDDRVRTALREILPLTARPFRLLDEFFAVDSTGFATIRVANWRASDHGKNQLRKGADYAKPDWRKLHAMIGLFSKAISGVIVTDRKGHGSGDSANLRRLAEATRDCGFAIAGIAADGAYFTDAILAYIEHELEATAFIPPHSNTTGLKMRAFGRTRTAAYCKEWEKASGRRRLMYRFRMLIEAVFSSVKRRFGDFVLKRDEVSREIDVLCKAICYNLCLIVFFEELFDVRLDLTEDPAFKRLQKSDDQPPGRAA